MIEQIKLAIDEDRSYHIGQDCGEQGCSHYIICHACGRKSYNTRDIEYKYCGWCNRWHDKQIAPIKEPHIPKD